jgi:hypothetical protein
LAIKKARNERLVPSGILVYEIRNYHIIGMKETRKSWGRFERGDKRNPGGIPYRDG